MAGTVERGVLADLRGMPQWVRDSGQAKAALHLARLIDHPEIEERDAISAARELRMAMETILAKAPREEVRDGVTKAKDDLAARRAKTRRNSA